MATACTSDDDVAVAPTTSTSTTIPSEVCEAAADDAIVPLQDFIAEYEELTPEEWNDLRPRPTVDAAQREMVAIAQEAVDAGCDPTEMEQLLQERIAELSGRGPVGRSIAAALRGEGPILGPPLPVLPTTVPRDEAPSTVVLEPGEDLNDVLRTVGPGSTIQFTPGTFEFDEPIIVDVDVTFEGAGREETVVRSSAEGIAVSFIGPGGFAVRDMTIEHVGELEATVLLAIEGPVHLDGATLSGGVAGAEAAGGGHGLVFAFEPIEGFPERTADERAGELLVEDTYIVDNAAAGALVTGDAAPTFDRVEVFRNGGCGLCFTSSSGGVVRDSTLSENEIGVQVSDTAAVEVENATVRVSDAVGISVDGGGTAAVRNSFIRANNDVGIQATGGARLTLEGTSVSEHEVGVLVAGNGTTSITDTELESHAVGIQVGGEADVQAVGNTLRSSTAVALSFSDDSVGRAEDNDITDAPEVSLQVAGNSTAAIVGNRFSTAGAVAISVVDDASPVVTENDIRDHDVGIQAGGSGAPDIRGNTIANGAGVAINVLGEGNATVTENDIGVQPVGIQVAGSGAPEVRANTLAPGGGVAINIIGDTRATVVAHDIVGWEIGIQVGERAAPRVTDNSLTDVVNVGILVGDEATGRITGNRVTGSEAAGMAIGGDAAPVVDGNELTVNAIGIIVSERASGSLRSNTIQEQSTGIQVVDAAAPFIFQNDISISAESGIVLGGTSTARVEQNILEENGNVTIQVAESARPEIAGNELIGTAVYGLVFRDSSSGTARDNRIVEHIYGIQVVGTATPALIGNELDEVALTNISFSGASGGSASGNTCFDGALTTGISVSEDADPEIGENQCTEGRAAVDFG